MPRLGTQEFLPWKYELSQKNCAEALGQPLEAQELKSVASELVEMMADIRKRTVVRDESISPTSELNSIPAEDGNI